MISVRPLQRGQWFAALLFSSLTLLALTGCGSAKVHPVSGKVNFNGKPMVGTGSITFIPAVQKEGTLIAGGTILEDGTYTLTTTTDKPVAGALEGEYRVAVSQVTSVEPKPVADGEPPPQATAAVTPEQLVPAIYSDHAKTPLTATVKPGKNTIDFELPQK